MEMGMRKRRKHEEMCTFWLHLNMQIIVGSNNEKMADVEKKVWICDLVDFLIFFCLKLKIKKMGKKTRRRSS